MHGLQQIKKMNMRERLTEQAEIEARRAAAVARLKRFWTVVGMFVIVYLTAYFMV
jgi:hypothetical protein